jgi:hypothetical protein
MISKHGKLFKRLSTNQVVCIPYNNTEQNYYTFIQNMKNEGYNQCIVTSDIMIKIIEYFILRGSIEITSIEFMVEDEELETEIRSIVDLMKQNAGYWEVLKQKLAFLSQNDSIEIKKVNFRYLEGLGALFSVQANGIIIVSENAFNTLSNIILQVMGDCIK